MASRRNSNFCFLWLAENSSSQSDESDTADELNQKQKQKASHASPRTNQAQSSYVANTLVSGGDLAVSSEGGSCFLLIYYYHYHNLSLCRINVHRTKKCVRCVYSKKGDCCICHFLYLFLTFLYLFVPMNVIVFKAIAQLC